MMQEIYLATYENARNWEKERSQMGLSRKRLAVIPRNNYSKPYSEAAPPRARLPAYTAHLLPTAHVRPCPETAPHFRPSISHHQSPQAALKTPRHDKHFLVVVSSSPHSPVFLARILFSFLPPFPSFPQHDVLHTRARYGSTQSEAVIFRPTHHSLMYSVKAPFLHAHHTFSLVRRQ